MPTDITTQLSFFLTQLYAGGSFTVASNTGMVTFGSPTPDAGISRTGFASLAVGNGTTGDFSGVLKLTTLILASPSPLLQTSAALTDQAGAQTGTLTNAPSAGNPTKWIAISDNGVTRKIPTWT